MSHFLKKVEPYGKKGHTFKISKITTFFKQVEPYGKKGILLKFPKSLKFPLNRWNVI